MKKSEQLKKQLDTINSEIQRLQKLRKALVEKNMQTIRNAQFVVTQLGIRFEHELRYPWDACPAYRFQKNKTAIEYYTGLGQVFLTSQNEFEETSLIVIYSGNRVVCRYRFSNNPKADKSNNLFVPGEWSEIFENEASAVLEAARVQDLENEIDIATNVLSQVRKTLGENL